MDAVAENWSVIVDDNYTCGMALPFTRRLGVEILYTPIFVRYIEWFGSKKDWLKANAIIRSRFNQIELNLKEPVLGNWTKEYMFQVIDTSDERTIRSQAKRSINKALKNELTIEQSNEYRSVYDVIRSELESKIQGLDTSAIERLEELLNNAKENNMLMSYMVSDGNIQGGILCIENKSSILYLKGAVADKVKKNGGMYLAMDQAIKDAVGQELQFDFGGSRVEGVRTFNHNLGGKDAVYYAYEINKGPKWFNFARRLKSKWSRK